MCAPVARPASGLDARAVEFADEKARINDLCSGCAVCVQLCPVGAIVREGKK